MKRLIIVGNGFDLAHDLPTGYCDFIDWYWRDKISITELFKEGKNKPFELIDDVTNIKFSFGFLEKQSMDLIKYKFERLSSYQDLKKFIGKYKLSYDDEVVLRNQPNNCVYNCSLNFTNAFFEIINSKREIQNWIDIENEYYSLLKECLKDEDSVKVKKLNDEFEQVKKLLEKYLHEEVANKYDFNESNEMQATIDIFDLNQRFQSKQKFLSEFGGSNQTTLQNWLSSYKMNPTIDNGNFALKVVNLFLNFNYTPTVANYKNIMNGSDMEDYGRSDVIQIHGKLHDNNNPINFGFGDEMDKRYQEIEEKDDNEYLRNIKSFQYLQNSNYKKMLSFVESQPFQVYIMGHSCGLSDRILLNKIFEHANCRSIKVFYYKNGDWDNYTDIVQNISRHFNKKEMMREKIVNKTLCEPLPQIKLPLLS